MVLLAHRSSRTYTGTKVELEATYKKIQIHNLLLGWWGIISFFWNALALYRNAQAMKKLRSL